MCSYHDAAHRSRDSQADGRLAIAVAVARADSKKDEAKPERLGELHAVEFTLMVRAPWPDRSHCIGHTRQSLNCSLLSVVFQRLRISEVSYNLLSIEYRPLQETWAKRELGATRSRLPSARKFVPNFLVILGEQPARPSELTIGHAFEVHVNNKASDSDLQSWEL